MGRRLTMMYDRMNAVVPVLAQRLERDRERRQAEERLQIELLERLDRILSRLPELP